MKHIFVIPNKSKGGTCVTSSARKYIHQFVPEVTVVPSQVGCTVQIDLNRWVNLRWQFPDLNRNDAMHFVLQGLYIGSLKLQDTPFAFKKITGMIKVTLLNT